MNIREIHPEPNNHFECLITKGEPLNTFCKPGYETIEVAPVYDDKSFFRVGDKITEFLYECSNRSRPVRIRSGVVQAVLPDGNIQVLIDPVVL